MTTLEDLVRWAWQNEFAVDVKLEPKEKMKEQNYGQQIIGGEPAGVKVSDNEYQAVCYGFEVQLLIENRRRDMMAKQLEEKSIRIQQLGSQICAIGTAAAGQLEELPGSDPRWSPFLRDVMELRKKFDFVASQLYSQKKPKKRKHA